MTDANYWGINGKISRTVASNNLTVAIVDYDGSNFSSLNPLVYKIGDTPRILDGALSVTVNAGANTFNAGSTELATKEIDYFVYLGWRASNSSVFILISRIPYATTYADFSGTSTNEKYGAYSGAAPASTDPVVNIGRFNATNSGTASYNWSVPATSVIVNHPIYETRWLSYTPTPSTGTGSSTFGTCAGLYKVSGRGFSFSMNLPITNTGTGGNGVKGTTPFVVGTSYLLGNGRENQATGLQLQGILAVGFVSWLTYANGHPGGTNYTVHGGVTDVPIA